ncbi:hypothetical protein [Henriciella aquimarina]|uniref:hypothetical protein n=1 Tax=Henriciella aquimarina TaxID=545261 RepID=UPI001F3C50CF|nr:hypothetical protein [Henriciella aquimarina]
MITSLDGRLHPGRWSDPVGDTIDHLVTQHYDTTAETFDADGWIVGRKSMAEYLGEYDAPELLASPRSRPPHMVERDGRQLAIVIDPSGRIAFDSGLVDGEQAVSILSERVSDETLSQLREKGVAYVFAGADGHDLGLALDWLGQMMETYGTCCLRAAARRTGPSWLPV